MAFNRENLSIVVNNVKSGIVPSQWLFWNESTDTVTAAGFIVDKRVLVGDQVDVLSADFTAVVRYRVSAVSAAGAATLVAGANTTYSEGGIQLLTGAGAINVTTGTTLWTTNGANAGTLADGVSGQRKIIKVVVDGGAGTLTPANLGDGTTLTFTEVNDACELLFDGTNWWVIANSGVVVA